MTSGSDISEYIGVMPESEFDLVTIVENGLPLSSLTRLEEKGLTAAEISQMVVSSRTLRHRRARGEHLSDKESERVVRIARIVILAEDIFGSREKGLLWLRSSDDRIGNRNPIGLLCTESGGRLVESMLGAIDEGIFT